MLDYILLHVGSNDAMDYEASAIVKKILQVKEFIKLRVPNCKIIISRPTKRHDNDNASRVIEEVIAQFQKLTIDMIGNENIEKKQLGKRGFYLNGFGLKKSAQNLIAGIRELWIVKKSFCDDVSRKTNHFKECKLYHNSGVLTTKNNTFSEEHDLLCTSSKHKNDCHYKEAKIKLDIDGLIKVRNSHPNNPIIGYLHINTLQNKIINLREIIAKAPLDVFCVDETKLDDSFPNSQFILENLQFPPFRRDRKSKWGGKLICVKQGIIAKRLENLETKFSETVGIELTISKKKWCSLFAYRPRKENKTLFFEEVSSSLSHTVNKYDSHFSDLKDTYDLSNLVKSATCFKSSKGTLLDVLLTNKPKSF